MGPGLTSSFVEPAEQVWDTKDVFFLQGPEADGAVRGQAPAPASAEELYRRDVREKSYEISWKRYIKHEILWYVESVETLKPEMRLLAAYPRLGHLIPWLCRPRCSWRSPAPRMRRARRWSKRHMWRWARWARRPSSWRTLPFLLQSSYLWISKFWFKNQFRYQFKIHLSYLTD